MDDVFGFVVSGSSSSITDFRTIIVVIIPILVSQMPPPCLQAFVQSIDQSQVWSQTGYVSVQSAMDFVKHPSQEDLIRVAF